jgi:hypothetical protein
MQMLQNGKAQEIAQLEHFQKQFTEILRSKLRWQLLNYKRTIQVLSPISRQVIHHPKIDRKKFLNSF